MMNKRIQKSNSGFTLIELIVTISIVAILASIAAPSFKTMISNNKASVASNELVSALLLARSEALKRKNNVTICISDNQTTCKTTGSPAPTNFTEGWIVFVDCDKDQVVDTAAIDCGNAVNEPETMIKAFLGSKGMEVTRTTGGVAQARYFTYNLTGRTDAATSFDVKSAGSTTVLKTITVSLTGRVKTTTPP